MRLRSVPTGIVLAATLSVMLSAQEKVDYGRDIDPIFKRSCYSCHGNPETDITGRSKTPKGGVRLDQMSFIMAARRSGAPLVKPKDPASSLLYELISLPAGDPDIMPPDDSPLKAEEQALIKRWIEEGADFGTWGAAGAEPVVTTPRTPAVDLSDRDFAKQAELLKSLAEGLQPLDAQKLKNLAGDLAQIEAIDTGSPLYRVSFNSHLEAVNDATLKSLADLADQIVELRLGRTQVSDKGMVWVAKMPRLLKLDLSRTEVGDAGLQKLAELRHLQSLNLYGTKVTDAGLPQVVSLPALQKLYLWQSAVTETAVTTLQKRLPKTQIYFKPELPSPDQDEPRPARRRR